MVLPVSALLVYEEPDLERLSMATRKIRHTLNLLCVVFSVGLSDGAFPEVTSKPQSMYERLLDFPALVKGGAVSPIWRNDGNRFVYLSTNNDRNIFLEVDPASGSVTPFFDVKRLQSAIIKVMGSEIFSNELPFQAFTFVNNDTAVRFEINERWFELFLNDYSVTEISPEKIVRLKRLKTRPVDGTFPSTGPRYTHEINSPTGNFSLSVKENNLWLRYFSDDRFVQITHDGTERYQWTGATWSEDGTVLAAFKQDSRQVHYMPVTHWLKRQEEVQYHLYPQAGGPTPQLQLVFIDVLNRSRVPVNLGQDATYVRVLGWHPNKAELLFFWLARDGKRIELRAAQRHTGTLRVLWAEENRDTFVVDHMQFAAKPAFKMLSDGRFIISSERSGWNHLYLYGPRKGKYPLIKQLTNGHFPVQAIVDVDPDTNSVYFLARNDSERVYDQHLMRVGLNGRAQTQLTEDTGHHQVQFSPSKDYFLDIHSTVNRPQVVQLRLTSDGRLVKTLEKMDITALTGLGWRAPEEFVAKAADGKTDLHGIIRKPWNFDPAKSYPVIEYIYAGPQRTNVPRTFVPQVATSHMIFSNALSQLGFIVVTVDARGTPERSKQFQDTVYGNLGRHEISDHSAALREMAESRPFMDMNRVGVFGNSYGGYFTIRALLQNPDLFQVGVASAPAVHLHTVAAGTVESYMGGKPQDVPTAYEHANNLSLVNKLKGKLLILHPTSDINVPFAHSMQLIDGLIQAEKQYDFKAMPEGNHHYKYVNSTQRHQLWNDAVRDYFVEHLRP